MFEVWSHEGTGMWDYQREQTPYQPKLRRKRHTKNNAVHDHLFIRTYDLFKLQYLYRYYSPSEKNFSLIVTRRHIIFL
eukprot:CCRYP_003762-RA/>CCRYP_003762-RA protein AED:0.36 eAED:0.36 QI:166/1/1/1/0/0/2/141/77